MDLKRFGLSLAIAVSVLISGVAASHAGEVRDKFIAALEANDKAGMYAAVNDNLDAVPAEILELIKEAKAPGTTPEDRGSYLYIAELMAKAYKDKTGDLEPLLNVKKRSFEARLGAPVRLKAENGVDTILIPKATGETKNIFEPDNVIIKQGETVRWVNSDEIAHIFSTLPLISAGKFFAKSVEPGESWEFKFEKPGEYFYLCFIHPSMVGKITVEGAEPAATTAGQAPDAKTVPAPPGGLVVDPATPAAPENKATEDAPAAAPAPAGEKAPDAE